MAINIGLLKHFVPKVQLQATRNFSGELKEVGERLEKTIEKTPSTYETENINADDKIVYLHYFAAQSDWYIVEKDEEKDQLQAFGYAILNGDRENAEWGYINIENLIQLRGVELDFYFTPKMFSEVMKKKYGETQKALSEIHDIFDGKETNLPNQFTYGASYGVPKNDGKRLIDALEGSGFIVSNIKKGEITISQPDGKKVIVNDNGGEFNLIDKESDKHIADIAYDTTEGIVSIYKLKSRIYDIYDQENEKQAVEGHFVYGKHLGVPESYGKKVIDDLSGFDIFDMHGTGFRISKDEGKTFLIEDSSEDLLVYLVVGDDESYLDSIKYISEDKEPYSPHYIADKITELYMNTEKPNFEDEEHFVYGIRWGVPESYGRELIDELKKDYNVFDITSNSFKMSRNDDLVFKITSAKDLVVYMNKNGKEEYLDTVETFGKEKLYSPSELAQKLDKLYFNENHTADEPHHQPETKETEDETKIVKTIEQTEAHASPLEEIEPQNPVLLDLSYQPVSETCKSVDLIVPVSMRYELTKAMQELNRRVNGVDAFVALKLGYIVGQCSIEQKQAGLKCLCDAFSAEQVDAIAQAIYNIEVKGQGCIIADGTGSGKGRVAAGIIRYALLQGITPIFITEKPNLFSDIYRDLIAIGSDDAIPIKIKEDSVYEKRRIEEPDEDESEDGEEVDWDSKYELIKVDKFRKNANYDKEAKGKKRVIPFIVNGGGKKTSIKDENGNILYEGFSGTAKGLNGENQKEIFLKGRLAKPYNLVLSTYSQFNRAGIKTEFINRVAKGSIVIMDESHNASGDSKTGEFLKEMLVNSKGCTFLSATFAKRPDNMPIYADKTCLSDSNLDSEALVYAITNGGVALQEIISASLVSEGQLIRRERSFEGVEVNYKYLDKSQEDSGYPDLNLEETHKSMMDNATTLIMEIMEFQEEYVDPVITKADSIAKKEYKQVEKTKGTNKVGIANQPIFSGVFNVINQLLFSIKADAVAQVAIQRLKEGKKPVIGFANTMESFLDNMTSDSGESIKVGDTVNADFSKILEKRLYTTLRYTVSDAKGEKEYKVLDISEQDESFQIAYKTLLRKIKKTSIGISSSPIDVLLDRIENAGYKVLEVTGRNKQLKLNADGTALVKTRNKIPVNDAYRQFNDNEADCLLINTSGSTGASAHAMPTKRVSKEQVRQRVMIILQAELNINTEVQKRGRIHRTGQILKPIYDYVVSAIPAEKRLMMMLQKKLKSLDANTTSNQKQSAALMDVANIDFLNKIGDQLVYEYCLENKEFNEKIGDPLKLSDSDSEKTTVIDAAQKVSGRVAILSCKEQEEFYTEISNRYISTVEFLIQTDQYDLEVKDVDLKAETLENTIVVAGIGGKSVFSRNSVLEKCRVVNLRKPYKKIEVENLLKQSLGEFANAESLQKANIKKLNMIFEQNLANEEEEINEHYDNQKEEITSEKGFIKLSYDARAQRDYVNDREKALEQGRKERLESAKSRSANRLRSLQKEFEFFKVGRVVAYPSVSYTIDRAWYKAICLGFQINDKSKNPYTPSAIKLRFAVANSLRYIAIPMSKYELIDTIKSLTYENIYSSDTASTLDNWDKIIAESSSDTVIRYIVTGNILQAYGVPELKGNLISYTTNTGGIKKGILLPDGFTPSSKRDKEALRITVPLIKALPLIKSMTFGSSLYASGQFTFSRMNGEKYKIIVPASKSLGGQYYLDDLIRRLVNGQFEKSGGNMIAEINAIKIDNLVEYLQEKFKLTVALVPNQFERIKDTLDDTVDYQDEEKRPEDIFIEKLTVVDKEEENRIHEEETRALAEIQANQMAEQLKKTNQIFDIELEKGRVEFDKKLVNLLRLFHGEELLVKGGKVAKSDPHLDELKREAYKIGEESCRDGLPRIPAHNNKLTEFMYPAIKGKPRNYAREIMLAFESGYYNENEKELRKRFPKLYNKN